MRFNFNLALQQTIGTPQVEQMRELMLEVTRNEAVEVLAYILHRARTLEKISITMSFYVLAVDALFEQHPGMDVNCSYEYDETRVESIYTWDPSAVGENYSGYLAGNYADGQPLVIYYKVRYTPLELAVKMNITAIIDRLLAHPMIDVAAGSPIRQVQNDPALEKRLLDLHLKQFCEQAKAAKPEELPALIKKHEAAGLTPQKVHQYLVSEFNKKVHRKDKTEIALACLTAKAELDEETALNSYLGDLKRAQSIIYDLKINSTQPQASSSTGALSRVRNINDGDETNPSPGPANKKYWPFS